MLFLLRGSSGCGAAAALMLCGCDLEPRTEDCPDGSAPTPVPTTACDDVFDCPPAVRLAFSTDGADFELMQEDEPQELWFGGEQGGYHFFGAVETHGLCDVVFLDFGIDILPPAGGRENLVTYERHPLAIRCEDRPERFPDGCDGDRTQQRWWPMQIIVPCDQHPVDDGHDADCPDPPVEPITESEVILTLAARDHSGDEDPSANRAATDEVRIEPVCCGGE